MNALLGNSAGRTKENEMDDYELRQWALALVADKFQVDAESAMSTAEEFFQYVKSGKLPDKTEDE